jgi:aspartokinase/homoserine dehydrogenase 1
VEIWSDVDGVMTADPRRDRDARTIARLSYAEATSLARAGAKVLHPRTLEPLEGAGIPVFVGNTLRPAAPGTWIGPLKTTGEAEEDGTAA